MCSLHTPRNTQTTTYTMANHRHQPGHLSMVPFWPDVIAVKDDHGAVCRLCHHIVLPRPLILSSHQLVVVCRVVSVAIFSSPALLSSCRTGWLLHVASHLSQYCLAPPSRCLIAPAGCCMLQTSVNQSGCTGGNVNKSSLSHWWRRTTTVTALPAVGGDG